MINLRIVLFFIGILISSLGIAMTLPLLIEIKNSEKLALSAQTLSLLFS